tara:strand:+ start:299 stop:592 length:294 start_codon:yes stop_codon:yes gene_type:complete
MRNITDLEQQKEDVLPEDSPEELLPPQSVPSAHIDAPYCALAEQVRIAVILTASIASIISPFSTGVYYPAVTALSKDLGVSVSLINLTISTYQVRER